MVRSALIDLHCHILPAIDDGPATIEQSVAMARAAHAAGTSAIVATPHVSWRYANDARTIAGRVAELNARLSAERIPLTVHTGAEIAMTHIAELDREELARLRLGGGPWLLIEPPFTPVVSGLELLLAELRSAGHRIVLAHPERCAGFRRDRRALLALVAAGALTSITAGSLTGRFGGEVRRFAMSLAAEGLMHNVASDGHDVAHRPPSIAAELAQAGIEELAGWLTQDVPAAILSGAEIPARPASVEPPRRRRIRAPWARR
jgi:protein-tyrosine phosphatase